MSLTRNQKIGALSVGGLSAGAILIALSKDALMATFLANTSPADAPETPSYDAEELQQIINGTFETIYGRRMASAEDYEIAAIGKLFTETGHCTAQIAELQGYTTARPGTLLTTAAHCVNKGDHSALNFGTTYQTASGEEKDFLLVSTDENPVQVWINPSYEPDPNGDVTSEVRAEDTALIFYPDVTPPTEITPITQRVFAYHLAEYNSYVLSSFKATAAGFSGDMPQGKSIDDDCEGSQDLNGEVVRTSCKINKGGSGSSLLVRNIANELESLAVLSGVSVKDGEVNVSDDEFTSYYAPYYHYQLDSVPFLNNPDQCVQVIPAIGANLRMDADMGGDTWEKGLVEGEILKVRDTLDWERAEIGEPNVWLEVLETEDGRDGYVRSDVVAEIACP